MFYIRADGNEKVGMGHVMRCLAVAEALKNFEEKIEFITADENPARLIEERGFSVKVLSASYDDMEGELPRITQLLRQRRAAGKPRSAGAWQGASCFSGSDVQCNLWRHPLRCAYRRQSPAFGPGKGCCRSGW